MRGLPSLAYNILFSLLEQLGRHLGINYIEVIANVITKYNLANQISYFIIDNTHNNDTCLDHLVDKFGFNKEQQRLCCVPHILNLVAYATLFRTDKESFENKDFIKVSTQIQVLIFGC